MKNILMYNNFKKTKEYAVIKFTISQVTRTDYTSNPDYVNNLNLMKVCDYGRAFT